MMETVPTHFYIYVNRSLNCDKRIDTEVEITLYKEIPRPDFLTTYN